MTIFYREKRAFQGRLITLTAFISPFRRDRATARAIVGAVDFIEVYCCCALEVCEQRDVKGCYRKARAGEIKEFTGVSSPYEPPEQPDLVLDTGTFPVEVSVARVLDYLRQRASLPHNRTAVRRMIVLPYRA